MVYAEQRWHYSWVFPILIVAACLGIVVSYSPMLAFAALGGVALLLLTCKYPEIFVVLTLFTTFMKSIFVPGLAIGTLGATPYMVFEGLAIVGMTWQIITKQRKLILPAGIPFLLFYMLFMTLSLLIVDNIQSVFGAFMRLTLDWSLMFLLVQMIYDRRSLKWLIDVLLIQGLAMVLWGIGSGLALEKLGLRTRELFLWDQLQKNDYAAYLALVAVITLAVFLTEERSWLKKYGALLLLAMTPMAWIFTYSRGGLLAIGIAVITFLLLEGYKPAIIRTVRILLVLGFIAVVGVSAVSSSSRTLVIDSFRSLVGVEVETYRHVDTIEFRIELAQAAFTVLAKHPLFGVGFNQWQYYSPIKTRIYEVQSKEFKEVGYSIHNLPLSMATNNGIFALIAYLCFVGTLIGTSLKLRNYADFQQRIYLQAILAAVIGFQVALQFAPSVLWEWPAMGILAGALHTVQITTGSTQIGSHRL
ncbi:MAG: O-antigen ligase family protein [Caldilineaceae bacterium]